MSETLIIDTGAAIGTPTQQVRVEPLPLYDENHPMLKVQIPEYKFDLPNPLMEMLVKRLKMTMKLYGGIGLSANQCGVFERVFVIGTDHFQIACINPRIIGQAPSTIKAEEGCLSFPGLHVKLDRPDWVEVEFTNEMGELKQMRLEGITARCFQHELDHMNGVRYTIKAKPLALQTAKKKKDKLIHRYRKANERLATRVRTGLPQRP
jgi:peptide deformylase